MTLNAFLPPAEVVSMDSVRERKPTPFPSRFQGFHRLDELLEGAGEAVELPDHEGIARAHVVEGAGQLGAVPLGTGCGLGENPGTTRLGEGIELEVGRLVLGRDPGVAHQHSIRYGRDRAICKYLSTSQQPILPASSLATPKLE